jgi:peptidoglycan-N-acetylglucosamine deacetylase
VLIPLAAAGAAAVLAHGAFHRNSPVFGRVVHRVARGAVAITFDDGPNPDATPRILEVLAREGVPATFFLLGRHVERWPAIAREVAAAGHVVGNHGWHHRKLHRRGPAYVELDIGLGTEAITHATGLAPAWFRAPHGVRSPWVNRIARAHGQRVAGWSLGVWDSDRPGADAIARRSVDGCRSGSILLLHDGDGYDPNGDRGQTAEALPHIIRGLRDRGFRFTTL